MKKIITSILMCCVLIVSMTGCGGSDKTKDGKDKISIAFPTWVGYTPFYIAEELGYFDKYNLDVELSVIDGLAERKMALAGGQVNGLALAADSLVNMKSEGLDVTCVYMLDNSNGSDGICTIPEIESIEDLKGKKIAVERNMCEHYLLLTILEEHGMSADDIEILNMSTAEAGAAFVSGEVDACVVYEPYISQCKKMGANTFTTEEYPVPLVDVIGFSTEFVEENEEAVSNLLKAINEASTYWLENENECAEICESGLGISVEDCIFTKNVLSIYTLEDNAELIGTTEQGQFYDIFNDASDFYYEQGVISNEVAAEDIINPNFIKNLSK